MRNFLFSIVIICFSGCKNETGSFSGLLPREKMEVVMWDIIGADVFTENFVKKDSLKNASIENMQLQNKIFSMHKVSRADFYESYEYYLSHTDLFQVILDSMVAKAERNRNGMMEKYRGGQAK